VKPDIGNGWHLVHGRWIMLEFCAGFTYGATCLLTAVVDDDPCR